ncbi:MAG: hypothetical protein IJS39_02685, partial [Synergistaceae bacterium]|nr:hypothetical protein [Synergistaceae bacterium]
MVKKLLLCMVLAVFAASPAVSSESSLYAVHQSIADIKDGKADLSNARFRMMELSINSDYYERGTMTLSGGRYSYWDGKAVQTVTGEPKTFELRDGFMPMVSNDEYYDQLYFLREADGGLNGVNVSWNFPDDPSMNGSGTVPNLRTTQEQLASLVPYMEYVYSGDKVSGFMVRLVNPSNVSVPVVQNVNANVSVSFSLADNSEEHFHLGMQGWGFSGMTFNAGETPEGALMFQDYEHFSEFYGAGEVNASDILDVSVSVNLGDSREQYEWIYCTGYLSSTRLWTNHMTEAHLVNGRSDYSRATFRELYLDVERISAKPEAQHLTNEGRMTIPGGGYTIKQTDEVIAEGQDMNYRLGVSDLEFHGEFMEYEPVDAEGSMIAFKGGAEKGLNGRTITWTFPDDLNMNGSGVVPDFKSVSEQIEQCVPYVEFVKSGDHIGSLRYRLVANGETGTAIHPNYRTDFRIYVQTKDGEGFSTENILHNSSSGEFEVSRWSGTRWDGTNRYTLDDIDYVRVRLYSYEDSDHPCVYQWFSRTASSSELPSGTIQPVQTLAPDTLQNIVNNVEGISSVSEINYLADDNISSPADPTDEMTQTVQEDQHEIIGALSSVKVD